MIQNIYPLGGPAATVCGATVKINAIVVPRPGAHRPAHSLQTTCKPPRSDNTRKRNGRSGTNPASRPLCPDVGSIVPPRKRAPRAHTLPAHGTPPLRSTGHAPVSPQPNRTCTCARGGPTPDDRSRFSSNISRIFGFVSDTPPRQKRMIFVFTLDFSYICLSNHGKTAPAPKPETRAVSVSRARTDL